MTLQALRNEVGDDAFFATLQSWLESNACGTGTTEEFIEIAEQESGQELDELFDVWLFTPRKPPASAVTASGDLSVPHGGVRARRGLAPCVRRAGRDQALNAPPAAR